MTSPELKAKIKSIMRDMADEDLPDGAYWSILAERSGLGPAEQVMVIGIVAGDPEYFGIKEATDG